MLPRVGKLIPVFKDENISSLLQVGNGGVLRLLGALFGDGLCVQYMQLKEDGYQEHC